MSGSPSELMRTGRLAHVLCSLASSRFTGIVYAEREHESLVISVRNGSPVFVEDPSETKSIPDALLEQGLLTKDQYAQVATGVVESVAGILAENEDIAFCQVAVQLGFLTHGQVDSTVARRVRGRLIQCIAWDRCRVEIDDDPDGLTGILEYPQPIGSLIYMGVRTFFDEDAVRSLLGSDADLYARLLRPLPEVFEFFQLETEEVELLSQLRPDVSVSSTIEQSAGDSLEGWQLLCMLLLAGMVEVAPSPFAATNERSGVRTAQSLEAGSGTTATTPGESGSQARMPAAREQSAAGSPSRMQPAREERVARASRPLMPPARGASQLHVPIPREEPDASGSQPLVREERVATGSRHRMPVAQERPAGSGSQTGVPSSRAQMPAPESSEHGSEEPVPVARSESGSVADRSAASAAPAGAGGRADMSVEAQIAERAHDRKRPTRKLSAALQRLDRELKQARKPQPEERTPEPAAAVSHGRAHVDQLIRMRHANMTQKSVESRTDSAKLAEDSFRAGQEALRENKFARAHELLRKACDADPNNEVYSMFCMWASLRAGTLQEENIVKLRTLLRHQIAEDQYKGFAYYALGHVSLVERKDEAAEKFFRRAIEIDKNNKDAERHLRVIELRRKTAVNEQRANKIFGIDIGIKKS